MILLLLAACGSPADTGSSCDAYVAAVSTCAVAHGAPADAYDVDAICAGWDDERDAYYGEWYRCRAAAYDGADCTTDAGWAEATLADACCTPPGGEPSDDPSCS